MRREASAEMAELSTLGERIRAARTRANISQEELARRVGVGKNVVSRWETGQSDLRADNLRSVTHELGVSADWLLDGKEQSGTGPIEDPVHWGEFLEHYPQIGDLSPSELSGIRDFAARTGLQPRSWIDYAKIADIVLTASPSPTFDKKASERRKKRGR